jgi:hypothetical protein
LFEQMFEAPQELRSLREVAHSGGSVSTPVPPEWPPDRAGEGKLLVRVEVAMRRYDDTIEVRRGLVNGAEAPEQFLWRGRLWLVHDVMAHWVETGPWWQQAQVRSLLGTDRPDRLDRLESAGGAGGADAPAGDLLAEREVWRVGAASGRVGFRAGVASGQRGIFDLVFDWGAGEWRLQHSVD